LIVVDASVVVNALASASRDGEVARERLGRDPDLQTPHLMDLEVTSTLRRRTAAGQIDPRSAERAIGRLRRLRVTRQPHGHLLPRIWELRANVTAYDASYLALAEMLGCTFVTADARLARVRAARCPVEVVR
jgi:predicted nucleic acid-binding protein